MGYHSYRGVLTPATQIFLRAQTNNADADGSAAHGVSVGGGLVLHDAPLRRPAVASANRVAVTTSDDELFVVHKRVLRPCIALTPAIRAAGPAGGSEVRVDVGCLVFDRVLLYLEAQVRCTPPPPVAGAANTASEATMKPCRRVVFQAPSLPSRCWTTWRRRRNVGRATVPT